jgi:hypothetical protein
VTTSSAPTEIPRRLSSWLLVAALAAVAPITWALARFDVLPHVTMCLFERATGRPCPGCGMTRSLLRLSQGDVAASLRLHPLGVVLAAFYVALLGATVVGLVRGGDPVAQFLERRGKSTLVVVSVLFVGVWILRAFVVPSWAPPPVEGR